MFDVMTANAQPTDDGTGVWFALHVKNTDAQPHRFVADFAYGSAQ